MTNIEDSESSLDSNELKISNGVYNEREYSEERSMVKRMDGSEIIDLLEDTECGYFGWRPRWLQRCNTSKFALALLCWFCAMQGYIVNGSLLVSVQTIERRYNMDSTQLGLITSSYDITIAILTIPIGYLAQSWHKPRALAASCLSLGLGSLIMASPHFIYGEYQLSGGGDGEMSFMGICKANSTGGHCNASGQTYQNSALYVFILAQFCNGIAGLMLFSLGIVYIYENVSRRASSMYIGIFSLFTAIGPAIAFLGGGKLLDIYVDVGRVDLNKVSITPDDPRWIGAWWINFLIASLFTFLCGLMLLCLGRRLPDAPQQNLADSEPIQNGETFIMKKGQRLRDLPKNTVALFKNHTFILLLLAFSTMCLGLDGIGSFFVKFVQNQFNFEASSASMLTGIIMVPSAAGAHLGGGYLVKRFDLGIKGMVRLSIGFLVLAALASSILLMRCDLPNMPGTNQPYESDVDSNMSAFSLKSACNADCNCKTAENEPICGIDNREYFSPCHAGCKTYHTDGNKKTYGNCSCIAEYVGPGVNTSDVMATKGKCQTACYSFPVFAVFAGITLFSILLPNTPCLTAILRSVTSSQHTYAMAWYNFAVRIFGTIPGPVLYGFVIDTTCIKWQEVCGKRGTCWIYDNKKFGERMCAMCSAMASASAVFLILALLTYRPKAKIIIQVKDCESESD